MNATLKAEIYTLQKSFTDLPKIEILKDIEAGDDCDWIQIRFDDTSKGHLFMTNPYPCRYVVLYPPDRLHFNKRTKNLEAVFFTSECITSIVNQMIHEYENPPKPISLGSNFHKNLLKNKQARSIYEQYLDQAKRPGDHDGIFCITLTNPRNANADNNAALRALKYDHETIFGLTNLPPSEITGTTLITKGKPLTRAIKEKAQKDLDAYVAQLLKDTEGKSDLKKAELIYSRIVGKRIAHTEDDEDYDFVGPVQRGRGCCSGYSKLLKYAFNKASIPCIIIYGDGHAWNMALIDGKLLTFDATWENQRGRKRYFALSIDGMAKDHTMDNIFFKEVA